MNHIKKNSVIILEFSAYLFSSQHSIRIHNIIYFNIMMHLITFLKQST